jgi:dipeptidyl aminopeptidase/acylaminoacyl peptidase
MIKKPKIESPFQHYTVEELTQVQCTFDGRFMPNKKGIVYVNDKTGTLELWYRPLDGQPQQLTTLKEKVINPRVSPNGETIIFTSDYGGNERYDLYQANLSTRKVEPLTQTENISETQHRFSPNGDQLVFLADPEISFRPQIFIMDLTTGGQRQLTKGKIPMWKPIWSPDGKQIAATRTGDWQHGDLLVISTRDNSIKEIKPPKESCILWPGEFSPDSHTLLVITKNRGGFNQLAIVDIKTRNITLIGPTQWDVIEAIWHPTSGIFFTRNISGRYGLFRMKTDAKVEEIIAPHGVISELEISQDGTHLLFSQEDSTHPSDIYLYDLSARQIQQLTHSLPKKIKSARLSAAEPFMVKSFDGTLIEGFLYKPLTARLGKPYPAVAVIHGGPNGQSVESFDPLIQALNQAGFVIITPNYRGSTGYGKMFEDLDNKDWGGGDRQDVRVVLEHFIAEGTIDRKRIGITGGSYGGYMTLIALAKDYDFYAAGADAFGMYDLVEDYELTKDRFGLWYETEMGTPQNNSELFIDRSPIHFLDQIKAPLIIFQGANDTNVPKDESDRMAKELRKRGHKVEYVVYENEGHGFTRRPNRIDYIQRTVDFFHKHLGAKK